MADFESVRAMAGTETGLCVVAAARPDGSVHSSVVNAGPMAHPMTGEDAVALVARGDARKVAHIRSSGRASVTFRRGWQWAGVEGVAEVVDDDDGAGERGLRQLLRDVFVAAGGTHDNWDEYDRVMAEEGRIPIFITPDRIIGVP